MDEDDKYLHEIDYDENENNFEYGEESNSETEADADLENQYYHSKLAKQSNTFIALDNFQKVLALQGDRKSEWGLKALKQIIKLLLQTMNYSAMMERYKELLTYMPFVTRNQSEKAINSILSFITQSKNNNLLCTVYEITIDKLKEINNNRLWFKINTKLGKLYCDNEEFQKVEQIIKELYLACESMDVGVEDEQKGSQLLDTYALEIQMYSAQNNYKKLREIYEKSLKIKTSLTHPLTMGAIRECGGKMYLRSGNYSKALIDFYEAFKNYDDSGSPRRCVCLKYLLFATMLNKSNINPLDSQNTRQFRNEQEVKPILELYTAYQKKDIKKFESILQTQETSISNDLVLKEYIDLLRRNIRIAVILETIKPYKNIKIPFISNIIGTSDEETEDLLVTGILDNVINGKIDQLNKRLIINKNDRSPMSRYSAVGQLTESIDHLQGTITSDIL